jgi:hypothetical protein
VKSTHGRECLGNKQRIGSSLSVRVHLLLAIFVFEFTAIDDDCLFAGTTSGDFDQRHIPVFECLANAGNCYLVRMGSGDFIDESGDLLKSVDSKFKINSF